MRRCTSALAVLALIIAPRTEAQAPTGTTYDTVIAPGANFDKATFRLWVPAGVAKVQAIIALVPGSNGDGRSQVSDTVWQKFAAAHQLALVGVQLTDKPKDQSFIEDYINVSHGSGQAFLDAVTAMGVTAKHPELARAPFLLWGMSAGGEFNYEFTNWKPERVLAFVVNKGGIYYTALASRAARSVPGVLFIGGKDLPQRVTTITGLFAVNRRGAALWSLAEEPAAGHIVGRSRDLALMLYDDVLRLRLKPDGTLADLTEASGFVADINAKSFAKAGTPPATPPTGLVGWFPTERVARAWQAMVTEQPFQP